jgi:hypothetical protein
VKKRSLFIQLNELLQEKRITPLTDHETDIYLDCDFALAERDNLRVHYEASVYFDDRRNTVFFWDCVLLGDTGNDHSCYSHKPYRYCYVKAGRTEKAEDGSQAADVFHLAEIPVLIRKASKVNGWKFRTVFNRKKSFYPALVLPGQRTRVFHERVFYYKRRPAGFPADVLRARGLHAKQVLQLLIMCFPFVVLALISLLKINVPIFCWGFTALGLLVLYKAIVMKNVGF